jgi:hypothetical protein
LLGVRRPHRTSGSPEPEGPPPRAAVPRQIVRLRVAALLLLACIALLPAHPAVAQDGGPSPSARDLRDTYPLYPSPQPAAQGAADPSPAAPADAPDRAPAAPSSRPTILVAMFALLAILAFAVGFAISARPLRRRREGERHDTVTSVASGSTTSPRPFPAQASAQERLLGPTALPPATRQAWTAEVQWQQAGGESFFCVIARTAPGGGAAVVAKSEPVEWPPASAATVQRLTAAARELETLLVAAGWRPLPPGDAWYAKRFAWQPSGSTAHAQPEPSIEDRAGPPARGRFDGRPAWPEQTGPDHVEPVPAPGDHSTP